MIESWDYRLIESWDRRLIGTEIFEIENSVNWNETVSSACLISETQRESFETKRVDCCQGLNNHPHQSRHLHLLTQDLCLDSKHIGI